MCTLQLHRGSNARSDVIVSCSINISVEDILRVYIMKKMKKKNIQFCRNSYKIQQIIVERANIDTHNTHIDDSSFVLIQAQTVAGLR